MATKQSRIVGDVLRDAAEQHPDSRLVQCGGDWLTYGEVEVAACRVAAGLQSLGVEKGDRVAVMLPNRIEFITSMFACAKVGAIQVPINTYLRGEFLRHQLGESQAGVVISDALGLQQMAPVLADLPELHLAVNADDDDGDGIRLPTTSFAELEAGGASLKEPDLRPSDLCNILYTSGTTGPSKGCMLTHGYYTWIPSAFLQAGWIGEGDTIFGANPLFHASGQIWIVMAALTIGGAAVVEPAFSASTFLSRARETKATTLFGMGAMGMALLAQPPRDDDRQHSVRQATWVPMTEAAQNAFLERFGIPVNSELYGQSECWPATITPAGGPRKAGAIGRVAPHMDVRIVDDDDFEVAPGEPGEIVLRTKEPYTMFQGYWNSPEATAHAFRNLWHHTGDNGRFDDEGNLYFVDRKKDSLRRRGENVSSIELEQAILKHPAVGAVAVHAVPSDLSEDDIKACIVVAGQTELSPQELFAFFKSSLPYYAIPRYVELLVELPVNANMRVQKFKLRDRGITDDTWDFEAMGLVVGRHERRS
jgi:crotonobetaine/carnitine-CoA ligase